MTVLLDTHVLVWWFEANRRLPPRYRSILDKAGIGSHEPVLVSDISLWEIALLHQLGRIDVSMPIRDWLEQATAPPAVRRCPITPAVAAETTALPETFHRDPADRIIVATARLHGATLLTQDRRIVDAGVVATLP